MTSGVAAKVPQVSSSVDELNGDESAIETDGGTRRTTITVDPTTMQVGDT